MRYCVHKIELGESIDMPDDCEVEQFKWIDHEGTTTAIVLLKHSQDDHGHTYT